MAVLIGIVSAFFFSLTFVLNQLMSSSGENWIWSASLRFLFMLPLFGLVILLQRNNGFSKILISIKSNMKKWILWSHVAFALFYIPLCFASTVAPGWLIASMWQITIVSGSLIAPFLEEDLNKKKASKIRRSDLFYFGIILFGIGMIEMQQISFRNLNPLLVIAICLMLVSAFSYPLGNRKILKINNTRAKLNTAERIFAMIICSLPAWIICSIIGYFQTGFPSTNQIILSSSIALFSGFIATYLFFYATQLAHKNPQNLANVEATQSFEVIFTVILGYLFLGDRIPSYLVIIGIMLVVIGVVCKTLNIKQS